MENRLAVNLETRDAWITQWKKRVERLGLGGGSDGAAGRCASPSFLTSSR